MCPVPNRIILHVDMDAFFVSVEQAQNPALKGKPVVVGGRPEERHGVVCSASYEARLYGIKAGMPLGEARRLCPQVIILATDHRKYIAYSERIAELLEDFSPVVEMASLDEAFVDLTGTEQVHRASPLGIAEQIRNRIKQELGLPASFGIASSRVVAKIAADCAKPQGLLWIMPGKERQFLQRLEIEQMPGIGPRSAEVLHSYGLTTLGDIQSIGEEWLVTLFGVNGRYLYRHACGVDPSPVLTATARGEPKSVSRSYTFPRDLYLPGEIKCALAYLCEHLAVELRRLRARAMGLSLCVRYADFETIARSMKLPAPLDDESDLLQAALRLLQRISALSRNSTSRGIRLLGVSALELLYRTWQKDLLLSYDRAQRQHRLHLACDNIKRRYGFSAVTRGSTFAYIASGNSGEGMVNYR